MLLKLLRQTSGGAKYTYHFSFWRARAGPWETILGGCFSFFLRELKLLHVQTVPRDPLVQALVDFSHKKLDVNTTIISTCDVIPLQR